MLMGLVTHRIAVFTHRFTKRKNKKYRYYFNQNLAEDKHHHQRFQAELPAHDLENAVEQVIS